MTFEEYQLKSRRTATYYEAGQNFIYPTLGLAGEAGEVADKIKKILRDNGGIVDEPRRAEIELELGDVLWYVSQIATELKISLEEIADKNIVKLYSRQDRGVLAGSGDNR
jgi:NTP pyrophosphatase (non-canonical NTP hydrolase)